MGGAGGGTGAGLLRCSAAVWCAGRTVGTGLERCNGLLEEAGRLSHVSASVAVLLGKKKQQHDHTASTTATALQHSTLTQAWR